MHFQRMRKKNKNYLRFSLVAPHHSSCLAGKYKGSPNVLNSSGSRDEAREQLPPL